MTYWKRRRAGFALMWVVVGTVVVVALVSATVPAVVSAIDYQRVYQSAVILETLDSAAVHYAGNKSFGTGIGNYPGFLHDLSNRIKRGVTTDHNSCGNTVGDEYTQADTTNWDNVARGGPFVNFAIDTNSAIGITTPIGVIQDSIFRTTVGGHVYLQVNITKVPLSDIEMLDYIVDGTGTNAGATAGRVRWVVEASPNQAFGDVEFMMGDNGAGGTNITGTC